MRKQEDVWNLFVSDSTWTSTNHSNFNIISNSYRGVKTLLKFHYERLWLLWGLWDDHTWLWTLFHSEWRSWGRPWWWQWSGRWLSRSIRSTSWHCWRPHWRDQWCCWWSRGKWKYSRGARGGACGKHFNMWSRRLWWRIWGIGVWEWRWGVLKSLGQNNHVLWGYRNGGDVFYYIFCWQIWWAWTVKDESLDGWCNTFRGVCSI